MSFRQKVKELLKPDAQVTIYKGGLEWTGKVVAADLMNPADSNVVLLTQDNKSTVIPINHDIVIEVEVPTDSVVISEQDLNKIKAKKK